MLDNINSIKQRDPNGALETISQQFQQTRFEAKVWNAEHDNREITSVVIAGMGGSALSALMVKVLLNQKLTIPFEVVRTYDLPQYVNRNTLVIANSYSGNTEETIEALNQATRKGAQLGIIASGGQLIDIAANDNIAHVSLPGGVQPRMAMISNFKGLLSLLYNFGVVKKAMVEEMEELSGWLEQETEQWLPTIPTEINQAKQLALQSIGKTPVFYGSPLTAPLAYKWKISWNETAKNTAFWNEYPEFNHNEFMGWTSHPVEKPFAVFDFVSSFDRPRIAQRFELSDRLLSGKRPHAQAIVLKGDTLMAQLLWGSILADFASTYAAILNGVNPVPVLLIEKLKELLADDPR